MLFGKIETNLILKINFPAHDRSEDAWRKSQSTLSYSEWQNQQNRQSSSTSATQAYSKGYEHSQGSQVGYYQDASAGANVVRS